MSSKFGQVKFYFIPWLAKLDNTDVSGRDDVLPIFALQGLSSGVRDFTDDFNVRHVASMTSNPNRSWCWIQFCLVRVKKLQLKFLVIRSRNATSLPLMSLSFKVSWLWAFINSHSTFLLLKPLIFCVPRAFLDVGLFEPCANLVWAKYFGSGLRAMSQGSFNLISILLTLAFYSVVAKLSIVDKN